MQEALPKGDINATTARTQGNVYKALHTAMKRYEKYKPEKERDNWQGRNQDSYLGGAKA